MVRAALFLDGWDLRSVVSANQEQSKSMGETPAIRGVLNIDKPLGYTSMAICTKIRAKLRGGGAPKRVKVGHGGTLDPLASGVLVVLIGRATREQDKVMGTDKRYTATIDLAHVSESHDRETELVPVEIEREPTREEIESVLAAWFVGEEVMQAPPAHSAVKIGGKRAYALARSGNTIEPDKRPVRIDSIEIVSYSFPELVLDVKCGKGTYIRSLARDVGLALGVGGTLIGLVRTQVGGFLIDDALSIDDMARVLDPWDLPTAGLD